MIVNLRGCNGSGKSTVAFDLLKFGKHPTRSIRLTPYTTPGGAQRWVTGYEITALDLIIVGPYKTACGGCDGIKTQALIKQSVRFAAERARRVFFEGVIVSTLFSGYLELSAELRSGNDELIWGYLDTPLDVCLARIQKRNGGKAINEKLVADKVRAIEATRLKALAAGETVRIINYKRATRQVKELLGL